MFQIRGHKRLNIVEKLREIAVSAARFELGE
jgi:hypothetical protein